MARKSTPKAPLDLSLEAYPAFVAQVAALADVDPATFPELACRFAEQYHDAMLAEDMASLELAEMAYPALVYALNGGTFFGCKAGPDSAGYVLERAVAARAGQVPSWGQAGEFLLELEGVRICVKLTSNMLGNHRSVDLHAVDWDKPFISSTGYRNVVLTAANHQGRTVDQALRLVVEDVLEREGGLVAIDAEYGKARRENPPAWLADALAGVRPDGQLNMFGDAPKDPAIKAPMSNAERQKALRKRRKEQQLKPVLLNEAEQQVIDKLRAMQKTPGAGVDPLPYVLSERDRGYITGALDYYEYQLKVQTVGNDYMKKNLLELYCRLSQHKTYGAATQWPRMEIRQAWADDESGKQLYAAQQRTIEALKAKVAGLEKSNALEVADRGRAFEAVEVLQNRLKKAGLASDYRKQPGE
ncbi:hypothetical protein [Pseudomonas quasicaspiana]|uniref:hypothetical protein n=1 Tax=Pseudomonas quasicaspiana TaxID=2829821 RepID=UPI001E3D4687|nr:hypothetical protein [Pseudomonas quasicaspiana]MCD5980531.1 hypothetical protein [Pseudomonas quasicaspiana]